MVTDFKTHDKVTQKPCELAVALVIVRRVARCSQLDLAEKQISYEMLVGGFHFCPPCSLDTQNGNALVAEVMCGFRNSILPNLE